VSTGLYVGLFWLGLAATIVMAAIGGANTATQELLLFAPLPMLLPAIINFMLIYKAWAAIQDGCARTSPGAAVGFMFIPFFNIYWLFVAIGGWGKEFNAFAERQGIPHRASGIFMTHCILSFFGLGIFTLTGVLVGFCRGINAVADRNAPHLPMAVAHRMAR
jgi:hypothetical protein